MVILFFRRLQVFLAQFGTLGYLHETLLIAKTKHNPGCCVYVDTPSKAKQPKQAREDHLHCVGQDSAQTGSRGGAQTPNQQLVLAAQLVLEHLVDGRTNMLRSLCRKAFCNAIPSMYQQQKTFCVSAGCMMGLGASKVYKACLAWLGSRALGREASFDGFRVARAVGEGA